MPQLFAVDWQHFFVPSVALAELSLRGALLDLGLCALMRLVLKRAAGTIGLPALLLTVRIAAAAQHAMAVEYHAITAGFLLILTLVFWTYTLDWLGQRFPRIGRRVHPPPLPLVQDGCLRRRNMRHELITECYSKYSALSVHSLL